MTSLWQKRPEHLGALAVWRFVKRQHAAHASAAAKAAWPPLRDAILESNRWRRCQPGIVLPASRREQRLAQRRLGRCDTALFENDQTH